MKLFKLTAITALGLVLAVSATLWWFLGDDAWIEGKIENIVSKATGRSLSIDGVFAVKWSMNPVLTAESIHLSNPPWAAHRDFARLEDLVISVDLMSLFENQVHIDYIDADNLVISLEEHGSEGNSWDFSPPGKAPSGSAGVEDKNFPVRIDRLGISELTVQHDKPGRTEPLDLRLGQLELVEDADQQVTLGAVGELGGRPFKLSGQLGPLDEIVSGGRVSHDIHLDMGEISLRSQGVIGRLSGFLGADISLAFSGPQIEWVLQQLALPLFSHGEFDFRLDLATEGDDTRLDLDGDLGSLHARAKGRLNRQAGSADLEAEVSGEDLGGLLEVAGINGLSRDPFTLKTDFKHASASYDIRTLELESRGASISVHGQLGDWPQLLDSELEYKASGENIRSWAKVLPADMLHGVTLPDTDFEFAGRITRAGDQPASTDTRLRLGKSRISVSGSLGRLPAMTGADLEVGADGPDSDMLLRMAGLEGMPRGAFSLKATVERDADYFHVRDGVVDLAGNHLEWSGQARPSTKKRDASLAFKLSGSDLGAWSGILKTGNLPARAFTLDGKISLTAAGMKLDGLNLQMDASKLRANGFIGDWPELTGTGLDFEVSTPTLANFRFLPGMEKAPALPLGVAGSVSRIPGGWAFQLKNGALGDGKFESQGKYVQTGAQWQVEATNRVSVPDIARVGSLAGFDKLPAQPLEVNGFASYQPGRVELRAVQGNIGDSQFAVTGTLTKPPAWSGSDISVRISGPDIGQLLIGHAGETPLPFSVEGRFARSEKSIRFDQVKASLGRVMALINGDLDEATAADLEVDVSAPSLKPIGAYFDKTLPDEPVRLKAVLQGTPTAFQAEKLDITLGESDIAGDMSVEWGDKRMVKGVFTSDFLDLGWLVKKPRKSANRKRSSDRHFLIPDTPIVLPKLEFADIDITLRVARFRFPNVKLRDIDAHAVVTDGNLLLEPFEIGGELGAKLSGKLEVRQNRKTGLTDAELKLHGDGVRLGIGTIEGQDPDTFPQSDISADLRGSGATWHALAASLDGHVEVIRGPGLTGNAGWGLLFGDFLTELINMVNPFIKTDQYTVNECAVVIANVESGLVTVDPFVSQTEKMTVVAKGDVDLHTEELLVTFNTKLRQGTGISASMLVNPFISLTGTLLSPSIGLNPAGVVVQGSIAVATMGISLLAKSLVDRYLSSDDPCGDALEKAGKARDAKPGG